MRTQELYPDLFKNEICEDYDARNIRDEILRRTDWTQIPDSPCDDEQREQYRQYRQLLRDISNQKDFPRNVDWNEFPLKKEIEKMRKTKK